MTFLNRPPRSWIAFAFALFALASGWKLRATAQQAEAKAAPEPTAQQVEFFEANIRPVFASTCADCHILDSEGDLRLDSREALLKGGENGPVIVPGDPENSRLMHAIRRDKGFA